MRRMLGSAFVGRCFSGARRRSALVWSVEPLESRVVPATIRVTSLLNAGAGTLRAAIEMANRASNHDTITFAHSLKGTITLTRALPVLSTDIAICGPGPSVLTVARSSDLATPAFRIFTVSSRAKVTISGLTITGGSAVAGGGIDNAGSLSVVNARISGNSVTGSTSTGKYSPAATAAGAGSTTPACCR